jgi:ribosomal protein S30
MGGLHQTGRLPNEDKKNWIACVQDREKWKEVVEKAKTFNH